MWMRQVNCAPGRARTTMTCARITWLFEATGAIHAVPYGIDDVSASESVGTNRTPFQRMASGGSGWGVTACLALCRKPHPTTAALAAQTSPSIARRTREAYCRLSVRAACFFRTGRVSCAADDRRHAL